MKISLGARRAGAIAIALVVCVGTANARDEASRNAVGSEVFKALLQCRDIVAADQRLACYDTRTATIATAEKAGEIVVADKTTVRETKKALFGYGGLNLPIFGNGIDTAAPTQIEAAVQSSRRIGYTRVEIRLDNGMVWRQVDDEPVDPEAGQKVTVRTAALGSYMMRIGSRSIRVMRVR